ncbi:hypothetical protein ACRE1S_04125 [Helicobacter himalayensis]|uniref:Uncharacterized protein n=1 Tax=Helicobacter turcicus TaxID=2867412 RepID=A0ABS7JQ62_9HELI|nr:hypothetical protein [Helicobacter turcicus]MBX7491539.1 hypothetical protein [Helicobacter turcicus]MBX7546399.1 hypothetical protein [Helicobacter turcicus]
MNKIQKLLNELCPNGVEYKPLCEVCHSERSEKSQNIESLKDSNKMFWRLICKQKNF